MTKGLLTKLETTTNAHSGDMNYETELLSRFRWKIVPNQSIVLKYGRLYNLSSLHLISSNKYSVN